VCNDVFNIKFICLIILCSHAFVISLLTHAFHHVLGCVNMELSSLFFILCNMCYLGIMTSTQRKMHMEIIFFWVQRWRYNSQAQQVALFSSKGRNVANFQFDNIDVLKLNIMALGYIIWVAWSPFAIDNLNYMGMYDPFILPICIYDSIFLCKTIHSWLQMIITIIWLFDGLTYAFKHLKDHCCMLILNYY
jgi:hypothetical protein